LVLKNKTIKSINERNSYLENKYVATDVGGVGNSHIYR